MGGDSLLPVDRAAEPAVEEPAVAALLGMLAERTAARVAHSKATAQWAIRAARTLGWTAERIEFTRVCALLHDVGMVAVSDEVMACSGALSHRQWALMTGHCAAGERIVRRIPGLRPCAVVVRAHHERFDGSGYPDGLAGREIPAEARLVAVASAFQAMIEDRPYRRALPAREALARLSLGIGAQWDPGMVAATVALFPGRSRKPESIAG